MTTPITQCSVFVQVWIDTNAVQEGQTRGIYLVDNHTSSGSQNEGSANLATACTNNAFICWQVMAIDPNFVPSGGVLQLQSVGNSNAWGPGGQPQMLNGTTFTGQAENRGTAPYSMAINVQLPGQSGMTLRVNPSIQVN